MIENKNRKSFCTLSISHSSFFSSNSRKEIKFWRSLYVSFFFPLKRERKKISCIVLIQTTENSADEKNPQIFWLKRIERFLTFNKNFPFQKTIAFLNIKQVSQRPILLYLNRLQSLMITHKLPNEASVIYLQSTCIKDLDLVKEVRWLFWGHFFLIFELSIFFGAAQS